MSVSRINILAWIFLMDFDRYKLVNFAYWIDLDFKHDGNDETYILKKNRAKDAALRNPKVYWSI